MMSTQWTIQGDPTRIRADAPPGLFLARDGSWFHDGQEIVHERLSALLHRSIARDDDGNLIVTTGRDRVRFSCEAAPFLVRALDGGPTASVELVLSDDSRAALPGELHVDEHGRVYARVKSDRFWALLSRAVAQQVMANVDDAGALTRVAGRTVALVVDDREHWRD